MATEGDARGSTHTAATIDDVARAAGVSVKTVSRVVNGVTTVAPALADRVRAEIARLDYVPSLAARQLAGQRNFLIALVLPVNPFGFIASLALEITALCRKAGYHVVMETIEPRGEWHSPDDVGLRFLAKPDSAILFPPFPDDAHLLSLLERDGIPAVRIGSALPGYGSRIVIDDEGASAAIVRHLIGLGHQKIAIIGPPRPDKPAEARVRGWRRAMEEAGLCADSTLLARGDFTYASGIRAATKLLAAKHRPTAIFAVSDIMASAALAVARRLDFAVPNDIAIAGFDDTAEARVVYPPITTVHQPIDAIAQAAVRLALARSPSDETIALELRARGSTTGDAAYGTDGD